jgi:pimeloyl-ACP methyl ester carboxylesterase
MRLRVYAVGWLWIACTTFCAAQQVIHVRWPTAHASPPVSLAGVSPQWLPMIRTGGGKCFGGNGDRNGLSQGQAIGLRDDEISRLRELFATYYRGVRKSPLFSKVPSVLDYCLSERKPQQGLATVYVPAKLTAKTKCIVFLHGYGGSLLAYPHYLSSVFSNHVIVCPAYGISPAEIPNEYVSEALKATGLRLNVALPKPTLIGLSAGGFGACAAYVRAPQAFGEVIVLGAYPPDEVAKKWTREMTVRFLVGSKESYVANGSFKGQMAVVEAKVKSLEWKAIPGADHFFLLSHQRSTQSALAEWERP